MRLLGFLLCLLAVTAPAAEVILSARHVIHHAADAPQTARQAALELQQIIQQATGTTLEITSAPAPAPAVRIVSDTTLPHDGFEIRLEGDDIIIAGNDDLAPAKPDAWFVPSHGTYFGVMEFLERFAGARWLLPGDLGLDVPSVKSIRVTLAQPLKGAPAFATRALAAVGETDPRNPRLPPTAPSLWLRHQRLTNGFHPFTTAYGHSWDDYLRPDDFAAHPEWKPSSGSFERKGKVTFFCTTAPGLVDLFAKRVIESIDRNPKREMTSISPTDGGGFCTCERCAKLISKDPHGKPNHALALLIFYNEVARIIERERPGHRLGGFVYYNYQYPPDEILKMPDNMSLCWAPLNYYGYGLLKPAYRAEFPDIMKRWSSASSHLCYHNYSTWMRSYHGAPLPPSLSILELELPTAAKNKAWGARMVGANAWGVHAPINYLLARQMWDAKVNVSAAFDEWLQRAYGPGWRHMRLMYQELDAKMLAHKQAQPLAYKGSQYEVNEDVMQSVYAPLFPQIEQHYLAAQAECVTDPQRARLAMFGDNLTQLHFALRKASLTSAESKSVFHRDDAVFAEFMRGMESSSSLYRDPAGIDHGPIWKGEYRAP
ncbi:DUF4838 domain-containing protein [Prosthecobacter sp.]|uniref:DUF4838 domain-containing protein n=1 Tax=Prosthecobacter sp. TaxID=1965333 RepID=UPI0037848B7B